MDVELRKVVLVSICIPVMNEEESIPSLLVRLDQMAATVPQYEFEYVFSDNASTDKTWDVILESARSNSRVRTVGFSKNFGFQNSIVTNYAHASGQAIIQIDADLQDPPELIPQFLKFWESGYKVVYGVRQERPDGVFIRVFRSWGYKVIDALSEHRIPRNVGDFRLIDRVVVNEILKQNHLNILIVIFPTLL